MCGWAVSQLKLLSSLLVPKMPPWIHIWQSQWAARASGREKLHLSLGAARIESLLTGLEWGSTLNGWHSLGPMTDMETWCGSETQAAWAALRSGDKNPVLVTWTFWAQIQLFLFTNLRPSHSGEFPWVCKLAGEGISSICNLMSCNWCPLCNTQGITKLQKHPIQTFMLQFRIWYCYLALWKQRWPKKVFPRRQHLNRDLNEVRLLALRFKGGRKFWAERTAKGTALDRTVLVWLANGQMWLVGERVGWEEQLEIRVARRN